MGSEEGQDAIQCLTQSLQREETNGPFSPVSSHSLSHVGVPEEVLHLLGEHLEISTGTQVALLLIVRHGLQQSSIIHGYDRTSCYHGLYGYDSKVFEGGSVQESFGPAE